MPGHQPRRRRPSSPPARKPGAKKPGAKKPGAKKPGAKKPAARKPAARKAGAERAGAPARKPGAPPKKRRAPGKKAGTPSGRRPPARRRPEEGTERPEWGGVARRGAREVGRPDRPGGGRASAAWRQAVDASRPGPPDEWVDLGEVREEASGAVGRGRRAARGPVEAPPAALAAEVVAGAGTALDAKTARRVERALEDGARAFDRERFGEARRFLQTAAELAPGSAAVHELFGLTLYRLGRWREAARELEAFRLLTGSVEQHPVLADCYRALRRYGEVDHLWGELKAESPDAPTVTEGRIVAAGALADQGRLADAVALLAQGFKLPRRAQPFHLRRAYALADLYERGGELPQARELFARIDRADPDLTDAGRRARGLG